ncbi:hypothetical protein AAVH_04508 [Aphelenchoides avenae]|nr:hypothetical protein AAVH_04508 [Aphelenchus avenae]
MASCRSKCRSERAPYSGKKTKIVFEDEEWITLCVHDGKIPLLEWYPSKPSIHAHEPRKVVDLLGALFVNATIGDDRCLIIGFSDNDRPPLEFGAPSPQECHAWVNAISSTLHRLGCLGSSENEYCPIPKHTEHEECVAEPMGRRIENEPSASPPPPPPPPKPKPRAKERVLSLSDEIPLNPQPKPRSAAQRCESAASDTSRPAKRDPPTRTLSHDVQPTGSLLRPQPRLRKEKSAGATVENSDIPPALPPRSSLSTVSTTSDSPRSSVQNESQRDDPNSAQYARLSFQRSFNENHYDQVPRREDRTGIDTDVYTRLTFSNEALSADSAVQDMCQLRLTATSSSTISSSYDSRTSSLSDSHRSSNPDDYQPLSPPPRPPKGPSVYAHQYDFLSSPSPGLPNPFDRFNETINKPKTISLLLTTCVEHIAFCEAFGKVWISGWSPERDNCLCGVIHFGDEIVQVGSKIVEGIHEIPRIFYEQSIPGKPIEIKIRKFPHGETFSITKPQSAKKPIGIVLHKRKNRIESIDEKSAAWSAGLPSRLPPYIYGSSDVPAVITEVNNVPLNPFACNDSLYHRLERQPPGTSFTVIVHPHDLVKNLKQQLKSLKNYKKFIHDS